ncbi:Hypothetical protein A7982_05212 [Minicystis rosea]|nr:Hypothetical protein A7982_05212 [Minicystis rosea]
MSPNIAPLGWPALAGAIVSAALGALFAGADTALTSLSSTRLEALIDQAEPADKQAYERIQREDAKMRSRYLLGRVATTVAAVVCLLAFFADTVPAMAGWLSAVVSVVLIALLFEISTTLARKHADRAALLAARWFRPLELSMIPLAAPLGWLGGGSARGMAS